MQRRSESDVSVIVCLLAVVLPVKQAEAASQGTLTLATSTVVPGRAVTVAGVGWAPNTVLQASICGANAVSGSVDCAAQSSVIFSAGPTGTIESTIPIVIPPKPCPCVVLIAGTTISYLKRIPVTVAGAATAPVVRASRTVDDVEIVRAQFVGSTPLRQWFGLPATRTVSVTVRNTGSAATSNIDFFASLGTTPLTNHQLAPLGAGREATYLVSVPIPALTIGNVNVSGHVDSGEQLKGFGVRTTIWPFGLLLLALVVIQCVLLLLRNFARRRHEVGGAEPGPLPLSSPESAPAEVSG